MRKRVSFLIMEVEVVVVAAEEGLHRPVPVAGELDVPAYGGRIGIDLRQSRHADARVVGVAIDILHQHPHVIEVRPSGGSSADARERVDAVDGLGDRLHAPSGGGWRCYEGADSDASLPWVVDQALHPKAVVAVGPETGGRIHRHYGFQESLVKVWREGTAGVGTGRGGIGADTHRIGKRDLGAGVVTEGGQQATVPAWLRVDVRPVGMAVVGCGSGNTIPVQQMRCGGGDRDGAGLAVGGFDREGGITGSEVVHIDLCAARGRHFGNTSIA